MTGGPGFFLEAHAEIPKKTHPVCIQEITGFAKKFLQVFLESFYQNVLQKFS